MAEQLLLPELKGFNVNEGVSEDAADVCRLTGADVFSAQQYAEFWTSVKKSMGGGTELAKASYYQIMPPNTQSFSRINYMPTSAAGEFGILQWPGIPPDTLEKMSREHVGILMLVGLRQDDVLRYADVSEFPWRPGWQIKPKRGVSLDSSVRKEIHEATEFLINGGIGGVYNDPRERDALSRVDFSKFLGEIVRSSLVYDGIAVWTEFDNTDKIVSFSPYPAQNIRLVANEPNANTSKQTNFLNVYANSTLSNLGGDNTNISRIPPYFAVAVDDTGNIISKFTRKQMVWYTRNSRVDAYVNGYGFCYDEKTEVLTKNGWKLFKDVSLDNDEIATLNKENSNFEWQKPNYITWEDYDGDMYELKSSCVDLLVTPNHKILYVKRNTTKSINYHIDTAEELFNKIGHKTKNCYYSLPSVSKWKGAEIQVKEFHLKNCETIKMSGDDYCAFMGMYLAEGYVPHNINSKNVYICQMEKSKGYLPFKELLDRLFSHSVYYSGREFAICRKALANYVINFGRYASEKFIPDDIMNATPRQMEIFWKYYLYGDGRTQSSINRNTTATRFGRLKGIRQDITTSSIRLANQLQELAQKMGYSASIYKDVRSGKNKEFNITKVNLDGSVKQYYYNTKLNDCYQVCLRGSKEHSFNIKKTRYKGKIGCVSVPNSIIYVRRNGKPIWGHNSEVEMGVTLVNGFTNAIKFNADIFDKNAVPKGILTIKGQFTQRQFDALGRVWDNIQRGINNAWSLPAIMLSEKGSIELVSLEKLRGEPVYYNNLINLFVGAMCVLWRIPVHRLGYKISGTERDSRPDTPKSIMEEDDVGLPVLLGHIEKLINVYILKSRWPFLQFYFTGKSPKEDARLYEARMLSMSLKEKRNMMGDCAWVDLAEGEEEKQVARWMDLAPVDPALAGIYQSIIAARAKELTGGAGGGGMRGAEPKEMPGARFTSKIDPARSESQGHVSGIRRDSAEEKPSTAKPSIPTSNTSGQQKIG